MEVEQESAARRDSDLIMTTETDFRFPSRTPEIPRIHLPTILERPGTSRVPDIDLSILGRAADTTHYQRLSVRDLLNSPPPPIVRHSMDQSVSPDVQYLPHLLLGIPDDELDPSFPQVAERYHLLHSLYHVCQDASCSYIRYKLLQHQTQSRNIPLRFHPYSRFCSPKKLSLIDNISTVCTHLWRKARSDLMAPRRAEADAVKHMRDLYGWGETIARGLEGNWVSEDDSENMSVTEYASDGPDVDVARFGEAAKRLCEWFGDEEAWRCCVETLNEIEDLDVIHQGERMSCDEDLGDGFI